MKRMIYGLLSVGGVAACCAATVQVSQLADGRAVPEIWNYAITAVTALTGLGLTGAGFWRPRTKNPAAPDHLVLIAALDQLFAHFSDDEAAQESVRAVARAVTERRYRKVEG